MQRLRFTESRRPHITGPATEPDIAPDAAKRLTANR